MCTSGADIVDKATHSKVLLDGLGNAPASSEIGGESSSHSLRPKSRRALLLKGQTAPHTSPIDLQQEGYRDGWVA